MSNGKFVVVTTSHRGVFGGILESYDPETQIAVLAEARNAVYWSRATRGVLGLAAKGPGDGSRIGPAAPRLEVNAVTAVVVGTAGAQAGWETEPWS